MAQKTAAEVMKMAGITQSDLGIAAHKPGYQHIVVSLDDAGQIISAHIIETVDGYYRHSEYHSIYRTGTGSVPCNCDDCQEGVDPADWAGDSEHCENIDDDVQSGIDDIGRE